MDRDCNKCVYSTREGGCRKWSCEGTKTVEDIRADAFEKGYISCQDFAESKMKELGIDYTQIFTCDKQSN